MQKLGLPFAIMASLLPAPLWADNEFFEKKIRPILIENCYECHSEKKVKGELRLDRKALAFKGGESGPVIVPNKPQESLLIKAIRYDGELKMPPRKKLDPEQIKLLTEWVQSGAAWPDDGPVDHVKTSGPLKITEKNWAFQKMLKPQVPQNPSATQAGFGQHPIDAFLWKTWQDKGLTPAPLTDKRTLIRRVTYDLIGLPPTPEEIDQFLQDNSANAYEKLIDRLLASPRYGERQARHWLDLVRYAETHGHEFDFEMFEPWRYRDYLIRAFNEDVPYPQLVREHIAGDLLEKPRRNPIDQSNESIQGTAFWYLGEAKHSPVDVRREQSDLIDNQIDVFAKTFLGLTVSCARCHDHKFDPIAQKDYYALYGILASTRYDRAVINDPDRRAQTRSQLQKLRNEWENLTRIHWADFLLKKMDDPEYRQRLIPNFEEFAKKNRTQKETFTKWIENTKAIRLGRNPWFFSGDAFEGQLPPLVPRPDSFTVYPQSLVDSTRLAGKLYGNARTETFTIERDLIWFKVRGTGTVRLIIEGFQLIQDPIYGGIRFNIDSPDSSWRSMRVSMWKGRNAYIELLDEQNSGLALDDCYHANDGGSPPPLPLYEIQPDDQPNRLFDQWKAELTQWKEGKWKEGKPNSLSADLLNHFLSCAGKAVPEESEAQKKAKADWVQSQNEITPPRRSIASHEGNGYDEPLFIRGNPHTTGPKVPRQFLIMGTPSPAPKSGSGRKELADWLNDPENPLVSRVMVNRLWRQHFGQGIVRSVDDFGMQGEIPSHPELLDWLAREFQKTGSIKSMHKLILMSRAYQMSSTADVQSAERDPQNHFFHSQNIRRLEAEAIRDGLLSVSGRLDLRMYGPSVLPHFSAHDIGRGRPAGNGPLDGDGRRSIYLQIRRNFLNSFFVAFDYPTPFTTIGKRGSTNVPAQALAMLNNPFVQLQAEVWAKKILALPMKTDAQRIEQMFLQAFGRPPSDQEMKFATQFIETRLNDTPKPDLVRVWSDLGHVIFNTKEFIFVK
ncbi:MAG: PSD1 and planctomycete cytochrome C domain-containing protein [Gemmataceae bacterium]|jgi:hypothetical protein|nr:PSD1 and planctomycete cytochrome C domain-containing protein [Gemmataceae bacterium]